MPLSCPTGSEPRTTLDDFRGLTIAVNRGSAYHTYLDERAAEYGWTVVPFGTNTDAVEAVATGRADANLGGNTVSAWAALQNPAVDLSLRNRDRPRLGAGLPAG